MEYRGIDVSSWQGVIDWKKVADHGTEFAIIRITEAGNAIDRYFERNYQIYRQSYVHSANSPISWHYPANPSEIACYPSAKICVRAPMRP